MKRLAIALLLAAGPVVAQTPPIQVAIGCDKQGNTVVLIVASDPGKQVIMIPRSVCGTDI